MTAAQRISIGIAAVVALAVGAYGSIASLDPTWPPMLLRSSIILSALWFAAPAITRAPRRVWIGISVVALVVVLRPRLILWGLAAGLVAAFLGGHSSGRRDGGG